MPRLIWVFAGRTLILLVLSCRGSYVHIKPFLISAIWRQFILLMLSILHRVVFTIFLGYKLQGKICEWEVFSMSQKHIFLKCPPPPPRSQRHLEISNKMESFPSYGSRIFFFFHYFWGHIIFLVPLLNHFIFFSCISRTKIFFDIKTQPPPLPPPYNQMVSPLCHMQQQRRRSA